MHETETLVLKKPFRVNNSLDGYDKLNSISSNYKDFIIGLEATGIYGENLWEYLNSNGYSVKLLNLFQTSRYREQITMKKVKNDNIDSKIIALLLKDGKFSSGYVTDDEYQSLRTLYSNRAPIQSDRRENLWLNVIRQTLRVEVKKRILTQVTVTFPELENFIDIFIISGLALLDKYPTAKHYERSSVDRILKVFRHIQGNNFNQTKALEVIYYRSRNEYITG